MEDEAVIVEEAAVVDEATIAEAADEAEEEGVVAVEVAAIRAALRLSYSLAKAGPRRETVHTVKTVALRIL